MATLHDDEFGDIVIRRSVRASSVKISVAPNGTLRASLPPYAPLFMLKRLVKSSRRQLRQMLEQSAPVPALQNGMQIGKSHKLVVGKSIRTSVRRTGQSVVVALGPGTTLDDPQVKRQVHDATISALRVEAKSYLPKRLAYLAAQLGYQYERVRFSHAGTRWGSCSTTGTISLNIALMSLPFELIDYVIVHELCHTKQMNHSQAFWQLVESADPLYRQHRKTLKSHSPHI